MKKIASYSATKRRNAILRYTVLTIYAVLIIIPILVMIFPTFQTQREASQGIFTMPSSWNFNNYIEAWKQSEFHVALMNSVIITVSSICINIFIGSLAAFPIGLRRQSRTMRRTFYLFLLGLMLPFQSIMIPLYIMMSRHLHLTNTRIGCIIVYVAMTLPLTVFFYSQFISSVPKEMEEAAVVDGCGYFRMFWQIYFPLLRPTTAALIIQHMLLVWNDLLVPLVLIDDTAVKPIMARVYMFFGSYYSQWNLAFSVLVLGSLPLLALFLALQKHFIQGMSAGAVKG